ncbi:MAG: HAD family phosphatase, partial [Bacteroidota bacterium]|nr:HAD family phosphatase [Bacteroidota bacterium]
PNTYNAVIFDLGGVLYDIAVQRSVDAFAGLGVRNFEDLYNLKKQTELFDHLEKGHIGRQEFAKKISKLAGIEMKDEDIYTAWNSLLIGMPIGNIRLLRDLRETYKVYLLSNTNELHLEAINIWMENTHGIGSPDELFDKAYYSFQLGMRKPDLEIYDHITNDLNVSPSKILFIDDNADNVKGAAKAGWNAVQKEDQVPLREIVKTYLG